MITDTWKPVLGYEGLYEVCSEGVKSLPRKETSTGGRLEFTRTRKGKFLTPTITDDGVYYQLHKGGEAKGFALSHLVLESNGFLRPSLLHEARHLDGNNRNNNPNNLAWGTRQENALDIIDYKGRFGSQKLTHEQVKAIKQRIANGETVSKIHKDFPFVSYTSLYYIKTGQTWSKLV